MGTKATLHDSDSAFLVRTETPLDCLKWSLKPAKKAPGGLPDGEMALRLRYEHTPRAGVLGGRWRGFAIGSRVQ